MSFAEVGALVRKARKEAKLSQADVARKLGMSRTTISQVEAGTMPELGVRKYLAICEFLGMAFVVAPRSAPTWEELQQANARNAREAAQATDKAISEAFATRRGPG